MLEQRLEELAQSDVYPFHMPGHKRRLQGFFPYNMDITEIEDFDNLHHAQGVLMQLQQEAAHFYQSQRAYCLVNGSTCGILAAISAAVPRGGRILVARNCHKSVYHAIYLRQLRAEYIYPVTTHLGIQGQISASSVQEKLEQYADIQAIVITSPTYDGIVSDIGAIAELAHQRGIPLIVDEAHGAHFGLHEAFPKNATVQGADAVIMSVHKTLPAPTQTALLHLCSDRIKADLIEMYLGIYETSSPSYVLLAGIEKSLQLAQQAKGVQMEKYVTLLHAFRNSVRSLNVLRVPETIDFSREEAYGYDIGKILMETHGTISGKKLQEILLGQYGLQMEMSSGNYVLAMTSFLDTKEGFVRLLKALQEIDKSLTEHSSGEIFTPEQIYRQPHKAMEIVAAKESETCRVPLKKAANEICADYVYLYPPGIPVIVPGEVLDEETIQTILECERIGLEVEGMPEIDRINIVQS